MILETTRGDGSDILIYSENRFNLENNFRMIRRNIGINNPIRLHYNEVCGYVNDTQPKTVVAYRLLTNLDDFDINYVKYGQQVMVNQVREVIYFDPIYCIKEMEDNGFLNDDPDLRFRIQQVGLQLREIVDGMPDFDESYSFDLEATEVQYQNDRSFAELLCAFDEIDFDRVINLATNETFDSPKAEQPKPEQTKPEPVQTRSKFQALTSMDLSFDKKGTADRAADRNITSNPAERTSEGESTVERKGMVTLAWGRKTTGLFEEDDNYDPYQASKRVHLQGGRPNTNSQAEISPGSTDQKNARFQVVGIDRHKSKFQTTQVSGRNQGNVERPTNKSVFSSFLERKRDEANSKPIDENAAHEELTDSMKEFANDREKRFVVLKLRK